MGKLARKSGFLLVFILLLHSGNIQAAEPLLIVTGSWPPYVFESDGNIQGSDVEIIRAVFRQLGIAVNIKIYPWKRCLRMAESRQADAILDASMTPEREIFLFFPEEHISKGSTVLFIRAGSTIPFATLEDLEILRVGTMLGYRYCDEIDQSPFMQHTERVKSLEQNFEKLLAGRLDVVVEADAVGHFMAKKMGISDQIATIPDASYCRTGNYLAFAKKPGYEHLASRFGQALQAFKKTDGYKQISSRYGKDAKSAAEE